MYERVNFYEPEHIMKNNDNMVRHNKIYHRSQMQTDKNSNPRVMDNGENEVIEFPALSVDPIFCDISVCIAPDG